MQKIKIIQKAVIYNDDNILALKRSSDDESAPRLWDLPGGTLRFGEKLENSIIREIEEETGLVISHPVQHQVESLIRKTEHLIAIIYKAEIVEEEEKVKLSNEHSEYKWVPESEILNLEWQLIISKYLIKYYNQHEKNSVVFTAGRC